MSKFDRQIGGPKSIKIKNDSGEEDTFTLYPLPFKYMPEVFAVMKDMSKLAEDKKVADKDITDINPKDAMKLFDVFNEETIKKIEKLIMATLEVSYPEEFKTEEKKKIMERFAVAHMMELLPEILTLNSPMTEDAKKINRIKEIKDK